MELGRKQCAGSNCREMVRVYTDDYRDEYVSVKHRNPGKPPKTLYYHVECAPFGNTIIPEELGIDE